jgi:hypothetical protein
MSEIEPEIERLTRNFKALGEAWRGDWSDFDGRQLRHQIDEILGGDETGVEFYHDRNQEYGPEQCPSEYKCTQCENWASGD